MITIGSGNGLVSSGNVNSDLNRHMVSLGQTEVYRIMHGLQ